MTADDAFTATALRLLFPGSRRMEADHGRQLLPRALPPSLPFDLPLPSDARLLGSLTRPGGGTVMIDVPAEPRAVLRWYHEALDREGWESTCAEDLPPSSASSRPESFLHESFWQPRSRSSISLSIHRSTGGSAVKMIVDTSGKGAKNAEQLARYHRERRKRRSSAGARGLSRLRAIVTTMQAERATPLARIRPPRRGEYRSAGSGSSSAGDSYQEAELRTPLSLSAIARHYHRQWTRRGWRLLDEGQVGLIAWSFWEREQNGERLKARWQAHHLPETPRRYWLWMGVEVGKRTPRP